MLDIFAMQGHFHHRSIMQKTPLDFIELHSHTGPFCYLHLQYFYTGSKMSQKRSTGSQKALPSVPGYPRHALKLASWLPQKILVREVEIQNYGGKRCCFCLMPPALGTLGVYSFGYNYSVVGTVTSGSDQNRFLTPCRTKIAFCVSETSASQLF